MIFLYAVLQICGTIVRQDQTFAMVFATQADAQFYVQTSTPQAGCLFNIYKADLTLVERP